MNDSTKETFGERVYRLRTALGLSQSMLAKKIGASHGSIQNYEANSFPKGEYAIKLAKVFDCSIDYLLTGLEPTDSGTIPVSEKKTTEGRDDDTDYSDTTRIIIEHQDMIKKFKNPEKAKSFNEFLLDIEIEDPEGYDQLYREAKAISKTIRRIKKIQPGERFEPEHKKKQETVPFPEND